LTLGILADSLRVVKPPRRAKTRLASR